MHQCLPFQAPRLVHHAFNCVFGFAHSRGPAHVSNSGMLSRRPLVPVYWYLGISLGIRPSLSQHNNPKTYVRTLTKLAGRRAVNNDDPEQLKMSDGLDRFTATGRPYKAPSDEDKAAAAYDSVMASDSFSVAGVNHLPVKFTDDSIISIPVLPHGGATQIQSGKKKTFWSRRKSENTNFVMKQMSRREYLEHYAKDDQGKYIGSEEPAEDCILRGEDVDNFKRGISFRNEVSDPARTDGDVVR